MPKPKKPKPIEKAKPVEKVDLTNEKPTAPIDSELARQWLAIVKRRDLYDFIIDAIDHGAGPVITILGLVLVATGHGSATDIRTIIGGITTGGGAVGTGIQIRRRQRRK